MNNESVNEASSDNALEADDNLGPSNSEKGQTRDRFGRFQAVIDKGNERSEFQKERDVVFSKVTRWKKCIENTIQKIQSVRPEVSQLYVLETNITRGNRRPVMFKTNGYSSQLPEQEVLDDVNDTFGSGEVGLTGGNEDIGPADVEATNKAKPRRPANLYCFLCKEKLGSDKNKRIGEFN